MSSARRAVLEHAGAILNTGDNTLTYADEHRSHQK